MVEKKSNKTEKDIIINEINKIQVTKPQFEGMIIHNPTDLKVISQDKRHVIIEIDENHWATYYVNEEKAEKEFQALQMGASRGITPVVYGRRGTYVVIEAIQAPTIADYLKNNSMTKELTKKLLGLLNDFKDVGFNRLDHPLTNIYVMQDGSLKVINLQWDTKFPQNLFPRKMIVGMGKQASAFLKYVQALEPSLYKTWTTHHKFTSTIEKAKLGGNKQEVFDINEGSHD